MNKVKILLVSRDLEQAEIIQKQLTSDSKYECFFEKTAPQILSRLENSSIRVLVMNLDYFGPTQLQLIKQIRALAKKIKILVLAERVNQTVAQAVEKIPETTILGKVFMSLERDFTGFLERVIANEKIAKRTSKRHPTRQAARVKVGQSSYTFDCWVINLSTSGAYLEFDRGHLKVSDNVQVILPLSELRRTHILRCKIAWVKVDSNSRKSAGLVFLR